MRACMAWCLAACLAALTNPAMGQPLGPDSLAAMVQHADSIRASGDLPGARVQLLGISQRALTRPTPDSVTAARAEGILGRIDKDLNNFSGAREHDERSLVLFGPDGLKAPANYRVVLQHYIGVLRSIGAYELALQNAEHLLALRRATPGIPQAEIAASLAAIASVLADLGRFEEATPRLEEAYRLQRAASGPDHVSTLGRLINLGNLALARADYVAAETLFAAVVEGRRRTYGPGHLLVAEALYLLALTHHRLGKDSLALCEGEQAAAIRRDVWRATIPFLPEKAALGLTNEYWRGHEVALDAALAQGRPNPADLARLWHTALELRTLVLDETLWRQQERRAATDAPAQQWKQWESTREAVSHLVTSGFDLKRDPGARARLDSLREAADSLESIVLARLPRLGPSHDERHVTWQQIADAVPDKAALVGLFRYGRVKQETPLDRWRSDLRFQYAALVFRGDTREIRVVALGDAGDIEELAQKWLGRISDSRDDGPKAEVETRRVGDSLRVRIWDPIARAIGPSKRVYLVPDGDLNQVAWDALPVGLRGYLIDGPVTVERLFSERDLVRQHRDAQEPSRMLAVGGPDFEAPIEPLAKLDGADLVRSDAGFACLKQSRTSFSPLPAAGAEAEQISRLSVTRGWSCTLLRGSDATVENLMADLPGANWVHIATHGFSLPDSCLPADYVRDQWLFEPLARHGLVLAGANRGGSALSESGDALLRGSEIALLDLRAVHEVDLSTCRSGAGIPSLNEGAFGLTRAFRMAGAHCIVCSLWPIGDETSASWMDTYSRARLINGESPNRAARQASRKLLSESRRGGGSTSPRIWASFAVWDDNE